MMLALWFVTPWLLAGVLAAGIPFALHLLASVRARQAPFPTLRFLRVSVEKTARRRRIQHWLLLVVRSLLLAILALAVAEPISEAVGGWLGGDRYAAVIVLDNSYSMATRRGETTRFAEARRAAGQLLSGDDRPALSALLTTNGGRISDELTGELDTLRDALRKARVSCGKAPLAQRTADAIEMLLKESTPRKAIYIFSDFQRISFEELADLDSLSRASDVHLFVVDAAGAKPPENVGISDVRITGRRVVNSLVDFAVTLVNSSPGERSVDVLFRAEGMDKPRLIKAAMAGAGRNGSTATVRFRHRFARAGPAVGEVSIRNPDDLSADNVRRFALAIRGRVRAVVVHAADGPDASTLVPADVLTLLLEGYKDKSVPWPISAKAVPVDSFAAGDVDDADIVFFCGIRSFSDDQAKVIERFVRSGGTAAFFLGPEVRADNYNDVFQQKITADGGLLPGRILDAVGQVGPDAPAIRLAWVDMKHPYLKGLYPNLSDYLTMLVQRYFRIDRSAGQAGRTLMRLANGDPLMIAKAFGKGRVVLVTTTVTPLWTERAFSGGTLPAALLRMSVLARRELRRESMFAPGAQVTLSPKTPDDATEASVAVTLPGAGVNSGPPEVVTIPVQRTGRGVVATFTDTERVGVYRWRLDGGRPGEPETGAFVVNPVGDETRLEAMAAGEFLAAMERRGIQRVYVGATLAEAGEAARADTQGRNFWDLLLAAVIVLLVVESVIANRLRPGEQTPAAHLTPDLAA